MTKLASKQRKSKRHTKDSKGKLRVPYLRLHKASGRAYVVLNGKAVYLGPYGDPGVKRNYEQAIAEWLAAGRQLPADPDTITIKELIARFWIHAEQLWVSKTSSGLLYKDL